MDVLGFEAVDLGSGASPTPDLAIEVGTTVAAVLTCGYDAGATLTLSSATLDGLSPLGTFICPNAASDWSSAVGAWWDYPTDGTQPLAWNWSGAPDAAVAFHIDLDGDPSLVDIDGQGDFGNWPNPVTLTLNSASGDFCVVLDAAYGAGAPANESGYTSLDTAAGSGGINGRLRYKTASGSTVTATTQDPTNFNPIIAFTITPLGGTVTGSGAITVDPLTVAGSGAVTRKGTGAIVLEALTVSGAGNVERKGTGAILLPVLEVAGTGKTERKGTGDIVLDQLVIAGSGSTFSGVSGSGAIQLASLTLSGTGAVTRKGTGAITLDALTMAGAGTVTGNVSGTGGLVLDQLVVAGAGKREAKGTGAIVLAAFRVSGYDVPPANIFTYKEGTAYDIDGRMVTEFIDPDAPLPAGTKWLDGLAHTQDGKRIVTTGPEALAARYIDGFAVRWGGVQLITTTLPQRGAISGIPISQYGHMPASTDVPARAVSGIGITADAKVSMTRVS